MADLTSISWADRTHNPWIGCTKVSPACDSCYAEARDQRFEGGEHWGAGAPRRRTSPQTRNAPLKWQREHERDGTRSSVFSLSLGDWADNEVPDEWRADLATTIASTPNLDWLLLTKRIGLVPRHLDRMFRSGVPRNVRIGATIVTQAEWERDCRKVAAAAEATRRLPFLSLEPLLSDIDFLAGDARWASYIGWVLVGGESGRNARSLPLERIRSIQAQCMGAGVPFHMKQLSQADSHTYWDPTTFPEDLQVREFPR